MRDGVLDRCAWEKNVGSIDETDTGLVEDRRVMFDAIGHSVGSQRPKHARQLIRPADLETRLHTGGYALAAIVCAAIDSAGLWDVNVDEAVSMGRVGQSNSS